MMCPPVPILSRDEILENHNITETEFDKMTRFLQGVELFRITFHYPDGPRRDIAMHLLAYGHALHIPTVIEVRDMYEMTHRQFDKFKRRTYFTKFKDILSRPLDDRVRELATSMIRYCC